MATAFKRVLSFARRCELYWKLSEGEKLMWVVERAYRLGRADLLRGLTTNAHERPGVAGAKQRRTEPCKI